MRCLASATYIVRQICNLGITVYTPSVALSAVIGIPYWASIVGMSIICIFFTIMVSQEPFFAKLDEFNTHFSPHSLLSQGGLKAAINADVIQTITILVVTVAVCIQGTLSSGGPKNVYQLNRDNGKQSRDLFQFDHVNLLGNRMALHICVCVCVCRGGMSVFARACACFADE